MPWQQMSSEIEPILFPGHLSSCPINQDGGGSEQGQKYGTLMLVQLEYSFPPHWAWARWITWMEKILQTGQMCQSPFVGDARPHGWHCDPLLIWRAWHPGCVQTPPHAARPGNCSHRAGGLGWFIFSYMRTVSMSSTPADLSR